MEKNAKPNIIPQVKTPATVHEVRRNAKIAKVLIYTSEEKGCVKQQKNVLNVKKNGHFGKHYPTSTLVTNTPTTPQRQI